MDKIFSFDPVSKGMLASAVVLLIAQRTLVYLSSSQGIYPIEIPKLLCKCVEIL